MKMFIILHPARQPEYRILSGTIDTRATYSPCSIARPISKRRKFRAFLVRVPFWNTSVGRSPRTRLPRHTLRATVAARQRVPSENKPCPQRSNDRRGHGLHWDTLACAKIDGVLHIATDDSALESPQYDRSQFSHTTYMGLLRVTSRILRQIRNLTPSQSPKNLHSTDTAPHIALPTGTTSRRSWCS